MSVRQALCPWCLAFVGVEVESWGPREVEVYGEHWSDPERDTGCEGWGREVSTSGEVERREIDRLRGFEQVVAAALAALEESRRDG